MVQVVAYPLFERVASAEFPAYHAAHSRLITYVVAPLMVGELIFATLWTIRGGILVWVVVDALSAQ